jgi:DNA polymerase IV
MSEVRFVALWIPGLRRELIEAARPDLRGTSWVLCAQDAGANARVDDVSDAARALGIEPGMRLSELRRRFPKVPVHPPDPRASQAFRRILSALCEARTPVWEVGTDTAWLDLSGTVHLFGGDWNSWAALYREDLARSSGVRDIRLAAASSRGVAEILSRVSGSGSIRLCPVGQELSNLEGVSLDAIPWLSRPLRERLDRLGLKTLGDIRRQPRSFLRLHLGAAGDRLSALASGLESDLGGRARTVVAETTLPRDEVDREALRAAVHELADKLAFSLRERSLGARELSLRIGWSDGQEMSSSEKPPASLESFLPLRDGAWRLLAQLDARRVAVRSLRLSAGRTYALSGQEDLFATSESLEQRRLGGALDRVRRRLGFEAVRNGLALA